MSFIGNILGSKTTTEDVHNQQGVGAQQFQSPGLQGNAFTDQYNQNAGNLSGFANNGAQAGAAAQQQDFANALRAQAMGTGGPSASQAMLQNALAQSQANTSAQIASTRGMNAGLALRQGLQANQMANQQAQAQALVGRQQEQLNAQGQFGNVLAGMRGQDIQNAGMYNQLGQGYNQMGLQAAQTNLGGYLDAQRANQAAALGAQQSNAGIAQGNTQGQNQLTGGVINSIGGGLAKGAMMSKGGSVRGKAKVSGDSNANDTVPTMLSPGEIVIPRSKAGDPEKAKEFIDHIMKQKKTGDGEGEEGYGKVLKAHRKLHDRVKKLEKLVKEKK